MLHIAVLWFLGVVMVISAFSTRAVYEQLDQDVPYIVWPTLMMQWAGYALLSFSLMKTGAPLWVVGAASVLLMAHDVMSLFYIAEQEWLLNLLLTAGVLGFAAAAIVPSTSGYQPIMVTALGAITVILADTVILPAEQDRRLSSGPGMALLLLGWLMMGILTGASLPSVPAPQLVPDIPFPPTQTFRL